MKISACYIVRDEAARLQKSLASLHTAADEIVVVDTGSTDATAAIAAEAGARVYSYGWQDDFAVARNFALTHASGDWVIFLDADEYFSPATAGNLRSVMEKYATPQAEGILVQKVNIDENSGEQLVAFFDLRIFQLLPGMRYERRIHEQLRHNGQPLSQLRVVPAEELQIIHTGYTQQLLRPKAERNLRLLQEELLHSQHPEELYTYLAEAYDGLGQSEQAMRYARLDIARGRQSATYASRSYRILLAGLAENRLAHAERRQTAAQAVKDFPELPEFHAEYAEALAGEFSYAEARQEMATAVRCFQNYQGLEPMSFSQEACQLVPQRIAFWQQLEKRQESIRITACVITKNEAAEIGRWIENAKKFADELIIVDTGSTDETVSIVQSLGIEPAHFAWNDDFSAAKNFAMKQAHGDWIVFTDADEYFDRPEQVRPLLAEMDLCNPLLDVILLMMVHIDTDQHNREIGRNMVPRLLRNHVGLRYTGCVHEAAERPDRKTEIQSDPGRVLLFHMGYSSGRIQKKIARNLALLQADIAAHGEGPQHYHYLADCYFGRKEYEKTLHYARLAMKASVQLFGMESDVYHEAIESMRQLEQPLSEMLTLANEAIAKFPQLPDFYAERGMIFCALGQLDNARKDFERAVAIFKQPQAVQQSSYFLSAVDRVYVRLGELYQRQGTTEKAAEAFSQALQANRYNGEALSGWVALAPATEPAALAALLGQFFSAELADTEYLAGWARREGNVALYLFYARQLRERYGRPDVLEPAYEAAGCGDSAAVYEQVMQLAPQYLQKLFVALLYLADTGEIPETVQLLPEGLVRVVRRYGGGANPLTNTDYDSYQAMLPAVMAGCKAEQIRRYAAVAVDFPAAGQYAIAGKLYENRQWAAAMELYQQVPADSPLVTAEFWHQVGICLYYEGEDAAAQESLQRAQALGDHSKDTAAYLHWLEAAGTATAVRGEQQ